MTTTTERLLQLAEEYDAKARALRLAAEELNGHRTKRKQGETGQTFQAAIALRREQREQREAKTNGAGRRGKAARVSPYTAVKAGRLEKARIVAGILKEAGRAMSTKELSEAAHAAGVPALTGIYGYVRRGYLTRTGTKKKHYHYSFKAMPPG